LELVVVLLPVWNKLVASVANLALLVMNLKDNRLITEKAHNR